MQEYKARCKGIQPGQVVGIQQVVPAQLKEEDEDEEDDQRNHLGNNKQQIKTPTQLQNFMNTTQI